MTGVEESPDGPTSADRLQDPTDSAVFGTETHLLARAADLDAVDPLADLADRFRVPVSHDGQPELYLAGNSLGLAPVTAVERVTAELEAWATLGVRGHFEGQRPWMPYHELVGPSMARLVGALDPEVVAMNALTVNLHLLMASFYRPSGTRDRILIESHAFPSDHFAAESQLRHHGIDPADGLVVVGPVDPNEPVDAEALIADIHEQGERLALVLLPGVQYYTGQVLPMPEIIEAAHAVGALVGLDLAHAVGNIALELHEWGPDFAAWCTYKYLNSGPGGVGGAFIHERHLADPAPTRLTGWWGTDPATRFEMTNEFRPPRTAEAWQLSNAPILSMASLVASLEIFDEVARRSSDGRAMTLIAAKQVAQAQHLDLLLAPLSDRVGSITPLEPAQRGAQRSLRIRSEVVGRSGEDVFERLEAAGVACDWRHPDVIRIAPAPLYNSFADLDRFVDLLGSALDG